MHNSILILLAAIALAGCSFDLDAVPPPGEDGLVDSAVADLKKTPDQARPDMTKPDRGTKDLGKPDLIKPDLMKPDTAPKKCTGPKDCADNIACTDDNCDGNGKCANPIKSGFCLIGGKCHAT